MIGMKITPVLIVEEIERSLPFWVERLGFQEIVRVPDGERIGFIMLQKQGTELMMQTAASVFKEKPKFAPRGDLPVTSLFVEVENLSEIAEQLEGYPIAMPERTTFYGMREIGVFEPSGNIVVFACKG